MFRQMWWCGVLLSIMVWQGGIVHAQEVVCPYSTQQWLQEQSLTEVLTSLCEPGGLAETLNLTPMQQYLNQWEEYRDIGLLRGVPEGALNTIGMRDSDGDGLSDAIELLLGSDPFHFDTMSTGIGDGVRMLQQGGHPTEVVNPDMERAVLITNIRSGMRTKDQRPPVVVYGTPDSRVQLYTVEGDLPAFLLGEGKTDMAGSAFIEPFVSLSSGEYQLVVLQQDGDGVWSMRSQVVEIEVDTMLSIPAPSVEDIHIISHRPQVHGRTLYGTLVVGHFMSTLSSSAIIADVPDGPFVITGTQELSPGPHRVVLYATLEDNIRSEAITVPFSMNEDGTIMMAPVRQWWWLLAFLPFLMILVWWLLRTPDTLLYAVTGEELKELQQKNVGGVVVLSTLFAMNAQEKKLRYVALYVHAAKDIQDPVVGTLVWCAPIIERLYYLSDGITLLGPSLEPSTPAGYRVRYVVQIPEEHWQLPHPRFVGKRYGFYRRLKP